MSALQRSWHSFSSKEGGRDLIGGEVQTPVLNFEEQEFEMFGEEGPDTELVQSIREQGTWFGNSCK